MPIAKKGDAADMDKLPFYKKKSGSLFKQICNMRDGLSLQNLSAMDESELLLRLESADRIYATFDKFQTLLEELDLSEMDSSVREDCDAVFISLKAVITKALHCSKSTEDPQASQSRVGLDATMPTFVYAQQRKHQLPVLQIPKFGGVYTEWPNFISMFNTIVGDDEELTNVEKFQHLRSSLKETALDTISSLEINGDNYDIAISMLIKRFDNKRLNFQAHIKEIFGLNIVGTEASSLRTLSDKVNSHLRSLLTMGNKEQLADGLLIHIVQSKLDVTSQMKWEEQTATNVLASWSNMESFLDKRCRMVENVSNALVNQTPCNQVSHKQPNYAKKSFVASESGICALCNSKEHFLYRCERFLKLDPSARYREAKRLKLCLNCLKKGHRAELCKFTNCSKCSKKHNTLLHMQTLTTFTPTAHSSSSDVASSQSNSAVLTTLHSNTSEAPTDTSVLLATAIILIKNRAGSFIPCRALLDSASQLNFITNRLASQLQLHKSRNFTQISGIGQSDFVAEYVVDIVMKSRTQEYSTILSAVVTTTITDNQPQCSLNHERWPIPKNIDSFADPDFFKSQRIDVLIGASHFFELLCVGQVELGPNLPILQKTKLGWIVAGGGQNIIRKSLCLAATQKLSETSETFDTLENLIRSFWEVENNFDETPKQTKEEIDCETHFKSTHIRLPSGEYSVRLPVKGIHNLGDSYNLALSRFKNLERKFVKSPGLKEQYSAFIQEYLELKHMTAVSSLPSDLPIYFLPHHCVHKIDSTTTKLRVVFDGSATTTSGYSLNDLLMAGPTIQPKLFDILIRFRTFPIALTGDICKMYRCIKVSPEDSYLQCILWRNSLDESIRIYKLDTVTYGTKPASFLAIRAMHQLAQDEQGSFPIGCEIVKRDFYVDDLISGANSVEEVLQLMNETKTLLNKGNFSLRKWCTSSPAVLSHIPEEDRDKFLKFHDGSDVTKTLGLIWDPAIDNFLFSFSQILEPKKVTKRLVLGMIARFYDPLGLIGPIVAKAKIFLQRLWKENLNWDESLPQSLHSTWLEFCKDFTYINKFSFPRYLLTVDADIEIHAFCDASLVAYGTCIYISSKFNKYTASNLLCSKSRVSPLKTITIPKLELLAAALQADLLHSIIKIGLFKCKIYCWSDSTVVLAWLKAEASNYNVFVANRITKIQALTKGIEWHYVPSALNPADILSKGSTPKELADSSLWLHGPEFLKGLRSEWPLSPSLVPELPEKRKAAKVFLVADLSTNFKFINSFGKTRRIFGYIYRFYANTKLHDKTFGSLTILEVNRGTAWLIRMIQKAMLSDDYKKLQKGEAVASASKIASLTPFLDESGLMRVGGRIQMSNLHYDSKHPIILPKQHAFTDALIAHFHQKYLHSGPLALLASIRLSIGQLVA